MLFDRADQTKEEIEFVCKGKLEDFFEITRCIELDQSQNEESIERFILSELAYFIDSNTLDNLADVIEKLKGIAMRDIGFDIGKIAKSRGMNSEDSE
jgi:predicted house-cleaning noncanonical NTP pyrophosphatase (MazG superfamily)